MVLDQISPGVYGLSPDEGHIRQSRSELSQKRHDALVLVPSSTRFHSFNLAVCEGFGFHLEIDFGVDIRCVQGNVAHPGPYSVDIYSSAEKVCSSRVSNAMRADTLDENRRNVGTNPPDVSFNQPVNAEARDGAAVTIQEHMLTGWSATDGGDQFLDRLGPNGTAALFISLTSDFDRREVPAGHMSQVQVGDEELRGLVCARAGIVKE